jgi:F-type H+-transporting ATPase subunit b
VSRRLRSACAAAALILAPLSAEAAGDGGASSLFYPVLNLLLLLTVLVVFVRKPVQAYFSDRRDRIQGELETAARLRKEAEERYARWQRRLAELDAELEGIRATSRERAEAERERILQDAQRTAARIRADAGVAVEQELRRARDELRDEAANLAIRLAGEMLSQQVTPADRERLLDEFIASVEQHSRRGAGEQA